MSHYGLIIEGLAESRKKQINEAKSVPKNTLNKIIRDLSKIESKDKLDIIKFLDEIPVGVVLYQKQNEYYMTYERVASGWFCAYNNKTESSGDLYLSIKYNSEPMQVLIPEFKKAEKSWGRLSKEEKLVKRYKVTGHKIEDVDEIRSYCIRMSNVISHDFDKMLSSKEKRKFSFSIENLEGKDSKEDAPYIKVWYDDGSKEFYEIQVVGDCETRSWFDGHVTKYWSGEVVSFRLEEVKH